MTATNVILVPGDDIIDAPAQQSISDLVSRLLVRGDGKRRVTEWDRGAVPAGYGFWEGFLDDSGADADDLDNDGTAALDAANRPKIQLTYSLSPASQWSPFAHFDLRDTLIAPNHAGTLLSLPVQQITIGMDEDGTPTSSIILGDRIRSRAARQSQRLLAAVGGASIVGASTTAASGFTSASLSSLADTEVDDIADGQTVVYSASSETFVPASVLTDDDLAAHVAAAEPHPAYDDQPDLILIFENGLI